MKILSDSWKKTINNLGMQENGQIWVNVYNALRRLLTNSRIYQYLLRKIWQREWPSALTQTLMLFISWHLKSMIKFLHVNW